MVADMAAVGTGAREEVHSGVGREEFLRLLIAQLRMQSPLRPHQGEELAVQLAIFSQLDQLLAVRQLLGLQLENMVALAETMGNAVAPALVGTLVRVESSTLWLPSDEVVRFGYKLPERATSVRLELCSPTGEVVWVMEFRDVPAGMHEVEWDGSSATGRRLPAGFYSIRIVAVGQGGQSLVATPFVEGVVEAVRFSARGGSLVFGELEVPLQQLIEVRRRP